MRAAWYERKGPVREVLSVGEMPDPQPERGEVRIRLRLFYERLVGRGKSKKAALAAVARKLLIAINAMMRDQRPWQPAIVAEPSCC